MVSRLEWLDVAKGLAIILVVLGHSAQYYLYPDYYQSSVMWRIIYSFHMPLFFILSGYAAGLSKSTVFSKTNLLKKIMRLLVPYFCWKLVAIPVLLLFKGRSWNLVVDTIYTPSAGGLWYLWALFFIWLIHSQMFRALQKIELRVLSLILVYVLLMIVSRRVEGHFGLYEISRYFIYYSIGFELCCYKRVAKNAPPSQNAVIWMKLLISTVLFVLLNYQIEGFAHNGMIGWLYEVVVALAGSMMIILLSQIVAAHFKTASKALQHLGNRTLGIYALNTYLIIAFSIAFKNSALLYPLSLVFVIGLSYAITIALSKNRLTSMLLLGEKKMPVIFLQTSK